MSRTNINIQKLQHLHDNARDILRAENGSFHDYQDSFTVEINSDNTLDLHFNMEESGCCGDPDISYTVPIPEKYDIWSAATITQYADEQETLRKEQWAAKQKKLEKDKKIREDQEAYTKYLELKSRFEKGNYTTL